ncbi:hypothetical protein AB0873_14840 [Micromonospora sp. NPDC047707]|uniref:hypothetical protein n=1 Tax=Micromonospora sp. NPDC047707 TaxID=3154498 RepID=UPI003453225A
MSAATAATLAAVLLSAVTVGLLGWIVLLLRADRHDHWVRVVAVITYPRPEPPLLGPDRPLVNPRFAAHIAAESARFAAAVRAGRHVMGAPLADARPPAVAR